MGFAWHAALASKDPRTKVGAAIFDDMGRVVSIGYNGFPRGVVERHEWWNDRSVKLQVVKHAEENAIAFASGRVSGCTVYVTLFPCAQCAGDMVQHGVRRVVTYRGRECDLSLQILKDAGIEIIYLDTHDSLPL